jgi:periplasmic divalent cation tolerance protein
MDALILLTTCPNEVATEIARHVVQRKLAACVNIIPKVQSIYRWHDAVEETKESLLLIKTSQSCLEKLEKEITKMHPYEVPEIISFPIAHAASNYLQWVLSCCAQP